MNSIISNRNAFVAACLLSILIAGCSRGKTESRAETPGQGAQDMAGMTHAPSSGDTTQAMAVANLEPTQGNTARGTVTFMQSAGGPVHVTLHMTGLSPGMHGFHVHENGDCSAPDGSSAGGHFNPSGMTHGSPRSPQHHMGDLGNITADEQGMVNYEMTDSTLVLDGGAQSIIGKSVIVHANPDDYTTQPSGNSGPRIACGVIERRSM